MANSYEQYYEQQAGNGISYYSGMQHQKGHGIGRFFGMLFKKLLFPGVKFLGKEAAKTLLTTGVNVGNDILSGEKPKESIKRRFNETVDGIQSKFQTGKGYKKRKTVKRYKKRKAAPKKKFPKQSKKAQKGYKKKKRNNKSSKKRDLFLANLNKTLLD